MAASQAMHPLSDHERITLVRILGVSARKDQALQPRQKAALDAYLFVLNRPPLDPQQVLDSARALIRTWAEVSEAARVAPPRKPSEKRTRAVVATLLDLPVSPNGGTEQLSAMALNAVLESYGYDE